MRRCMLLAIMALACCWSLKVNADEQKTIELFNGKDLSGWEFFLVDPDVKMEDVWSVKDGLLVCKGEPTGYLATKQEFKNFKLVVQWRWPAGKEPGNSGVLLRITGKPMMLPKCVEAQLKSESAGDIWAFQGFQIAKDSDRFRAVKSPDIGDFVGVGKMKGNENKPGEWNTYEITLNGGNLTLEVNGQKLNECSGCDEVAGKIGLQSEGGEIQFRSVTLSPLAD